MRVDRVCRYLRHKADQFSLTRIASTSRTGRNTSGSNEVMEGLPGNTGDPGDCALGNAEVNELADLGSIPVQGEMPREAIFLRVSSQSRELSTHWMLSAARLHICPACLCRLLGRFGIRVNSCHGAEPASCCQSQRMWLQQLGQLLHFQNIPAKSSDVLSCVWAEAGDVCPCE